jgi:hypothetical protein
LGVPKSLEPLADFIDREFLRPHDTDITGAMVVGLKEQGIPVALTLTILGAETSLGDPELGGELISGGHYNFGCLKYSPTPSPWGALATGKVKVRGVDWFSFPDAATGMKAWGLYISQGPTWNPGYYLKTYPNWPDLVSVYYGSDVKDFHVYLRHVEQLYAKFSGGLKAAGFES